MHVVQSTITNESRTFTMYATMGMSMGYTANTCVSFIHVSICKVDYMMANTFMYATTTLNYNKVVCIIPKWYRVASMGEHY